MDTMKKTSIEGLEEFFKLRYRVVGVTEYGVSLEDFRDGNFEMPPQGLRFDLEFEAKIDGPEIKGSAKGYDFLQARADGRVDLDIRGMVTTNDGETISIKEEGMLLPPKEPSVYGGLAVSMNFYTASDKYAWINGIKAVGIGKVNMVEAAGEITAYKFV